MKNGEFVSAAAGARLVGMDPRAFKKVLDRGEIKAFLISSGRRILYRREVLQWLRHNGGGTEGR